MLKHALKEWAVICRALATGRQALVIRKGGLAEASGDFQLEHSRFWLFPTYSHQQGEGITAEALPWLEEVAKDRPPAGHVHLQHFAEAAGVYEVHDIVGALRIGDLHICSEETVMVRYRYRRPGLFVIPLRVYRAAQVFQIPDTAHYAGCKSWVELEHALPTAGAVPVLDDDAFRDVLRKLDAALRPTAFA